MRQYLHALLSFLLVFSFTNMVAAQDGGFGLSPGSKNETDGDAFTMSPPSLDDVKTFNANMDSSNIASPVDDAVKAAKADPANAAKIAAEAAAANPDEAAAIALAVAKAFPGQRAKIAAAVAKAVPDQDEEIVYAIASDPDNSEAEAQEIWSFVFPGTDLPSEPPGVSTQSMPGPPVS